MRKLLIANRSEIAVRIAHTARKMSIPTVAVISEADEGALISRVADEVVCIGPPSAAASYLNQDAIIGAAADRGADAIHPGYGFLSENATFARRVLDAGLTWVGPHPDTIALMGDKVAALRTARQANVPVFPGSDGPLKDSDDPAAIAAEVGYPLLIKASAGGGGRGIRLVEDPSALQSSIDIVRAEAEATFGDSTIYFESFIPHARHVEVQILADGREAIHLGDRDCSMQRRSQKVLEEAPAPQLPEVVRDEIRRASVELAVQCAYVGAGTVEFLYDPTHERAAFIEMNTRLQVEHPVTEMVTGMDLVAEQLRLADGEPLNITQSDVTFDGHAIECRINAENPAQQFFPSPGTITAASWPTTARVDTGFDSGDTVLPFYDSMIAKIIVHGPTREAAITSTAEALAETTIDGIATTVPLHKRLIERPEFLAVEHHTKFIETTPDLLEDL